MRKVNNIIKTATNSRYYRMARRFSVLSEWGRCTLCAPHNGCNARNMSDRSWKNFRKTQWKP